MKTATKAGLIISLSLMIVGLSTTVITVAVSGGDLVNIISDDRKETVRQVERPYKSVEIKAAVDTVIIEVADDNVTKVDYFGGDNYSYDVTVRENVLYIESNSELPSYGVNVLRDGFSNRELHVYLSSAELDKLKVKTGVGSVDINDKIYIDDIKVEAGVGNVSLSGGVSADTVDIKVGVGSIDISKKAVINEIKLRAGIGSVSAPKAQKSFIAESGIGRVERLS